MKTRKWQIDLPSALFDNPATRWWSRVTRAPSERTAATPFQIGWGGWGRVLARTIDNAMRDDYGIVASSIAFAAFLSLLPLLAIVALLYSKLVPDAVVTANIGTLVQILPAGVRHLVREWLTNSLARHDQGGVTLLLSVVATLFGARRAGRSLMHGINTASGLEQDRGPIAQQLVALAAVLALAALLLTVLLSISAMALVEPIVRQHLSASIRGLHRLFWGSLTLGPAAALLLTYRYAPARDPLPWRWIWPGALTTALLWLGATLAFRLYVTSIASYGATYGSLSAVVVFLLWLMLSAFILLLGAKINAEAMRVSDCGAAGREQNFPTSRATPARHAR